MSLQKPLCTLLFSSLYPSSVRPGHGIFVETRLRELLGSGQVQTKVVAPVPWFPSTNPRFGDYALMASTPARETHHGIDVLHPRYFLPPKVGMNIAPMTMALGAISAVQKLLNEGFDFDVIDAHYYYPDGVAAALLAKYFKKPFTVTARGSDINLLANYAIPRKLMHWTGHRAAANIGVSGALTKSMAAAGIPESKIKMMPNGVDLARFRIFAMGEMRAQLGWPNSPTLICVGNLVENKGQRLAIAALSQLPNFRLVIAGEGPDRQALEALAKKMQVMSRVAFLGRMDQDRLVMCYGAADILVLPSSREGWPNVLLESMACGTPVVATPVGGIPEIITTPDAGVLMANRTAAALAQAVNALWNNLPSRDQVRACAEGAGWQATTAAQLELFNDIVSNSRAMSNA